MTTEQEFFEAFEIEAVRYYYVEYPFYICKTKQELINHIKQYKGSKVLCGKTKVKQVTYNYPPITPEILLKLIKIIIKQYRDFCIRDYLGAEYKAMCDNNWEDWEKEGKDCKTEEEAILSLCITIKDEIQDQVRGIFNEGTI